MPTAVPLFTLQFVLEDTHSGRNDKNQLPEFWCVLFLRVHHLLEFALISSDCFLLYQPGTHRFLNAPSI